MDVIVDRCAGLDVHKHTVMATVRVPDERGGRSQRTLLFSGASRHHRSDVTSARGSPSR